MATFRDTKVHFLKLVEASASQRDNLPLVVDIGTGEQRTLFAEAARQIVIYVSASIAPRDQLEAAFQATGGGTILDVRVAPRFDIGGLNRAKAFEIFEKKKISYVDYCGSVGARSPDDDKLAPSAIARFAKEIRLGSRSEVKPLCILLDEYQLSDEFVGSFMSIFVDALAEWDVLLIPQSSRSATEASRGERSLVFLSHAAPEDNAFASWLAAKLKLAGYEPWLDLSELRSGETFWPAIESTIRDRTAVVLALTSKTSTTKDGVLNEIHFANSLERTLKLSRFIIPVKVDAIRAVDMPIQLQRRQYVDFSRSWADGLRTLLNDLQKLDIPIQPSSSSEISSWFARSLSLRSRLSSEPETLISNWLPIAQLPRQVFLHSAPIGMTVDELVRHHGERDPLFVDGRWCTFHRLDSNIVSGAAPQLIELPLSDSYPTEDWIHQSEINAQIGTRAARRGRFVDLLRRRLEQQLSESGLNAFQLAGRRRAWFFPHEALPSNRVEWIDDHGKLRRKNLVGYSAKKSVYWHLALELKPTLWPQPLITVKLHVIFSANGKVPLGDAAKMHALRRRFCKSWWNDHWRDLMLAILFKLSNGKEHLFSSAPGDESVLLVERLPLKGIAPFSVVNADTLALEEEGSAAESEDELADDEGWAGDDLAKLDTDEEVRH